MAEQQFDKLLKQQEAAARTDMSLSWFEQNRFKGTGIRYVKIGRSVRYRESDIKLFIEARLVSTGI